MASELPQEKEWVPRQHIIGRRFGTLSRAAANKKKIFTQLIDEEKEEDEQAKGRPEQETGVVQVALFTCKDHRDGQAFVELMKGMFQNGKTADGFNGLWQISEGDGIRDAHYLLVQVGTCQSLADQFKLRTDEQEAEFNAVVKKVRSTIFTKKATKVLSELVEELNAENDKMLDAVGEKTPTKFRKNYYEVAESVSYALPGGWRSVDKFCKHVKDALVVRYDRVTSKTAEGMADIEAALGSLFSAPHRVTDKPVYRYMQMALGGNPECKTPLSFILKVDDTHSEVITFDSMTECGQDDAFVDASDEFKAAAAAVSKIESYTNQGNGLHPFSKHAGYTAFVGKRLEQIPNYM